MPPKKGEAQKEGVVPRVQRRAVRSPRFIEIYTNTSQGAFTPWDIEITFGRLDTADGEQIVDELVTVLMSPQHAKAVAKVMTGAVEQWEKRFGEIVLSEAQLPQKAVQTVSVDDKTD